MNKLPVEYDCDVKSKWLNSVFNILGIDNNCSLQNRVEFELAKFIESTVENIDQIIVDIKNNKDTLTTHYIKPTYIKLNLEKGKIVIHGIVENATVICVGSNLGRKGSINIGGNYFDTFTFMRGDIFNSEGLIKGKNCLIETSVEYSSLAKEFIENQKQRLIGEKIG